MSSHDWKRTKTENRAGFRGPFTGAMEQARDVDVGGSSFPVLSSRLRAESNIVDEREYAITTLDGTIIAGGAAANSARIRVLTALCSLLLEESDEEVSLELTSGDDVVRAVSCARAYIFIDVSNHKVSRDEIRRKAREAMNHTLSQGARP
ncbi:MAG: hypothetical protein AAGI01_01580 [Myxococcota bacterium]